MKSQTPVERMNRKEFFRSLFRSLQETSRDFLGAVLEVWPGGRQRRIFVTSQKVTRPQLKVAQGLWLLLCPPAEAPRIYAAYCPRDGARLQRQPPSSYLVCVRCNAAYDPHTGRGESGDRLRVLETQLTEEGLYVIV
ncbi:hypothetical protein [Calderihabitans maritimus]|uniref:(2Fe-2S)-binding protein n=1 Tax=Calderihabitans maritimus TaxID=1246530 RepID=A0A1Z5HN19_9FIRM|nr:hypothetical protein [Calderihabitans maritimus]GAW90922.1 (2Fe-2S)-binding protein [Calderihabitans maritimus]